MSGNPLKKGYYYSRENTHRLLKVDDKSKVWIIPIFLLDYPVLLDYPEVKSSVTASFAYGDFGLAREEIQKVLNDSTSSLHYNFEMKLSYMGGEIQEQLNGVITENGETIYLIGMWNDLECYKWQSEDDLKKLSDDRDSALAPACDYKIQPENQGKLVWLTGTPGAGKSTIGHLMSKEAGYVYYDSDAAEAFLNPFISPNLSENPTKQCYRQKPLKGMSRDCLLPHHGVEFLAKDVKMHKERMGGNFVIAHSVAEKEERDQVREILPDCIFVFLNITKDCQEKRLLERHGNSKASEGVVKWLKSIHKYFEPSEESEKNSYDINITDDMTPADVIRIVLDTIN